MAADVVVADHRNGSMSVRSIEPNWPRHPRIRACVTTREGGISRGPYASLNLGTHVGDDAANVAENRRRLRRDLGLAQEPAWLTQVHGIEVIRLDGTQSATPPVADAVAPQQELPSVFTRRAACPYFSLMTSLMSAIFVSYLQI